MLFHRPKPKTTFRQDVIAAIGRALLMAVWLAVLGVPLLLLGYCKLEIPAQQARKAAVNAARLAACQHHRTVQVSLGQHLLTVPANGAANLSLIADESSQNVADEIVLSSHPPAPYFFCIPPELDKPPLAVTSVRFAARLFRYPTPANRNLRVIHGIKTQDDISQMSFDADRPYWGSIPGHQVLSQPDPSLPAGQMATARAIDQREPPIKGSDSMIARTVTPDADGFLYAADCRWHERVAWSSCSLFIADTGMGLTYLVSTLRLPDDVYGWSPVQPVPAEFVETALMMRDVLDQMRTGKLQP